MTGTSTMRATGFEEALAKLEVLENVLTHLGDTTELRIEVPEFEAQKADWLFGDDRQFILTNDKLADAILGAIKRAMDEALSDGLGALTVFEIFYLAGEAAREHFIWRFEQQGGDTVLRPLSPHWLRWKAEHGFSTDIGIYTGDTLQAFRVARITFAT